MGKGRIVTAHGEGRYTIELLEDRARAETARTLAVEHIASLDGRISDLEVELADAQAKVDSAADAQDQAINAYQVEPTDENRAAMVQAGEAVIQTAAKRDAIAGNVRSLKVERLALQRRIDRIDALPALRQQEAWCADFTEDLAGEVATAEVPGEATQVLVRPGFAGNADYDAARDGALQPALSGTPASVYYNLAMLPGWQKWRPTYRIATITALDRPGNACDIDIEPATSSEQGLNVNAQASYAGVPTEYMQCNAQVFEIGDRVLVRFDPQTQAPTVIGFESNPRPCFLYHGEVWMFPPSSAFEAATIDRPPRFARISDYNKTDTEITASSQVEVQNLIPNSLDTIGSGARGRRISGPMISNTIPDAWPGFVGLAVQGQTSSGLMYDATADVTYAVSFSSTADNAAVTNDFAASAIYVRDDTNGNYFDQNSVSGDASLFGDYDAEFSHSTAVQTTLASATASISCLMRVPVGGTIMEAVGDLDPGATSWHAVDGNSWDDTSIGLDVRSFAGPIFRNQYQLLDNVVGLDGVTVNLSDYGRMPIAIAANRLPLRNLGCYMNVFSISRGVACMFAVLTQDRAYFESQLGTAGEPGGPPQINNLLSDSALNEEYDTFGVKWSIVTLYRDEDQGTTYPIQTTQAMLDYLSFRHAPQDRHVINESAWPVIGPT